VTYTDPNSSSTGRSVLLTLYTLAANKAPEQLTVADILDQRVVDYIRGFQRSVRHYVPDTLVLMDEIFGGPHYGHFFFISEDDLAKLYQGRVVGTDAEMERIYGRMKPSGPLERSMVMLYPREGATAHTHAAAVVQADWATAEQSEAAQTWIAFLREDAQQSAFMDAGFRPATALPLRCPICGQYGMDPRVPKASIDPNRVDPPVTQRIVESWGDVKNPGVVVFVVDSSLAMAGDKLEPVRKGIVGAVDAMYQHNFVGLLSHSTAARERLDPAPVAENRSKVSDAVQRVRPGGSSALYDAIREGVEMADSAPGEPSANRGVVVLTGAQAAAGMPLHELVQMASKRGRAISSCPGFARDDACLDEDGQVTAKADLLGLRLAVPTQHPVGVYFVGIGDNADLAVGRVIAEATGSNFLGTTVDDLGSVVKAFSKYF